MTLPEIRERGHAALLRELGPAGYVRFLQQLVPGRGDYTRDRKQLIASINLDDVKERLAATKALNVKPRPQAIAKEHFVELPTGAFNDDVLDVSQRWAGRRRGARFGGGQRLGHGFSLRSIASQGPRR